MRTWIKTMGLSLMALPMMVTAEDAAVEQATEGTFESQVDVTYDVHAPAGDNAEREAAAEHRKTKMSTDTTVRGYRTPQPSGGSSPDSKCAPPRTRSNKRARAPM